MRRPHLTYANVASTLALVLALGGVGYAATVLPAGSVGTKQLKNGAVTSSKVQDRSLRLHDLGGLTKGTSALPLDISIPAWGCGGTRLFLQNPAPKHFVGSLVVGYLTAPGGGAALDNAGMVVPTVISKTSQGGALANLVICTRSGDTQDVDAGSVFHWQLIGP